MFSSFVEAKSCAYNAHVKKVAKDYIEDLLAWYRL